MLLKLLIILTLLLECMSSSVSNRSNGLVEVENGYTEWLNHMASFKHSLSKKKTKKKKKKVKPCKIVKVSTKNKPGEFRSVQKAINSVPTVNNCRVVIAVSAGTYREKVEIPTTMTHITLKGAGADHTIIEWDDTADRKGPNASPLGTYASATFAVNSPNFIARNITFKNSAPLPPSGALGKQAVALRISADKATFISCRFIGAQDTLYDHVGRHYFKDCYIEGSVDFVFGNGLSLYRECHLHAIANSFGALAAQKRGSLLEETGFSFVNCRVTGSGALYLGRAWGTFSRVVFAYTYMDKIVTPRGWYDWGDKNRDIAPLPPSGALGKQAVALRISADKATFISCRFIGAQDTLYDHVGRHYFKDCYIEGSVDFVFGNGLSLYRECHLHAIANSFGALAAQKRGSLLEETGFSFVNCRVTGSGALYLGRAWGTFSRVVFAYTYMDKIVTPRGWYDWGDKNRDMTVFFGQYKCLGPGSDYGSRVPWSRELTREEAKPFISLDFIDGQEWLVHK